MEFATLTSQVENRMNWKINNTSQIHQKSESWGKQLPQKIETDRGIKRIMTSWSKNAWAETSCDPIGWEETLNYNWGIVGGLVWTNMSKKKIWGDSIIGSLDTFVSLTSSYSNRFSHWRSEKKFPVLLAEWGRSSHFWNW